MNTVQAPIRPTIEHRILPVLELRKGMSVALAKNSAETATLPQDSRSAVGGGVGTVVSVEPFGGYQVRVLISHPGAVHPSGVQRFIVPGTFSAVVLMPETVPVPHTPVCTVQ